MHDGLRLFHGAVAALTAAGVRFALGGAVAMAAHGASRATSDIDLLTTDARVLVPRFWENLDAPADVRQGDFDDPLRGVVRISSSGERMVDVVVHLFEWQAEAIARAVPRGILGATVPLLSAADLVLMKLYAGGPQDLWDIEQLLTQARRLR
jgi:hypothetical protein